MSTSDRPSNLKSCVIFRGSTDDVCWLSVTLSHKFPEKSGKTTRSFDIRWSRRSEAKLFGFCGKSMMEVEDEVKRRKRDTECEVVSWVGENYWNLTVRKLKKKTRISFTFFRKLKLFMKLATYKTYLKTVLRSYIRAFFYVFTLSDRKTQNFAFRQLNLNHL